MTLNETLIEADVKGVKVSLIQFTKTQFAAVWHSANPVLINNSVIPNRAKMPGKTFSAAAKRFRTLVKEINSGKVQFEKAAPTT